MSTSIDPAVAHRPDALRPRDSLSAMRYGFAQRCPACGKGRLFGTFLKVADHCSSCGEELHHHRADDAPPYMTIFFVGHIVVAGVLAMERAIQPEYWLHLAVWLPLTVLLSLWLLPRIKGAFVGLQWALRMHGFGGGPDPSDPQRAPAADRAPHPSRHPAP